MSGLLEVEAAAGLAVYGAKAVPGTADARAQLTADRVPERLAAKDPTLWGPEAEAEAKIRLGWVDTFRHSREMLPALAELHAELESIGIDHVVLAGMGGSSLAPEVIARTLDVDLTILDSTDPHQVRAALTDRLANAVVVVSSKSGGTIETDSHRRAYLKAFEDAGLPGGGSRFVIVTDPGSPFEAIADEMGANLFLADPNVGGRYSALTAFGLVPTALAGVDVAELLDEADDFSASLASDAENPALSLGAALAAAALAGRDKLALVSDGTGIVGLGDWIEQLIAESTGKQGRGILPVVVESPDAPGATGDDVLTVTVGGSLPPESVPGGGITPHIAVNGPLGAHFLAWEYATAVAGRLLQINPFDQPNVAESKENTQRILSSGLPEERPAFTDGTIEVYGTDLGHASTVDQALGWLLGRLPPGGYLAVLAFLDRFAEADAAKVRAALAGHTPRPVTFGWGPRYLHSTGQYHKGGPQTGAFLQITGAVSEDLPVPGRPYTFGQLEAAQAAGDRAALARRGRPLVRLHLTDRKAGAARLLAAANELPWIS
ncbi:glucose-6-phosphate isomerase [Planosporangium flavigriseum]|uniref:Glucose-6-phosphate isomerase n=1 Tax=Planosporangium flavigriseum TaxID=373681 RepID=A0A8J3PMV6_9ACTN|nr:glucose-6-phosphate isomerase [Planosporangium flavigriseum]NJC65328.1 glucose-6-phosphate isomerase [Planosporangium flavigriseum]GIG73316.1 glucose-6-phosphate isomerase [Planosporangium flavigriseum]